ncbi:hypothetical protein ACFL4T_13445 [candidate division KSB1 bacterium]
MRNLVLSLLIAFVLLIFGCGGSKELAGLGEIYKPLASPNFSLGDRFEYEIEYKFNPLYFRTQASKRIMSNLAVKEVYTIVDTTKIINRDVYVINSDCYNKQNEKLINFEIYVDRKNGEIVKDTFDENVKIQNFNSKYTEILALYESWMLKLGGEKSFQTKEFYKVPSSAPKSGFAAVGIKSFAEAEKDYSIKDIEIFNNKKCFKVEAEINIPIMKQDEKYIYEKLNYKYLIDVDKRVIVKMFIEGPVSREKVLIE